VEAWLSVITCHFKRLQMRDAWGTGHCA